ncbi:MAG UNVERIFIED_CONTAM: hypothetical protein LVT10_21160 [Anaerolineae bacterium]|jgi:hypothetical protein
MSVDVVEDHAGMRERFHQRIMEGNGDRAMRTLRESLQDLQSEIEKVALFTVEGKESFLSDVRSQYAVMMVYMRIGEDCETITI